LFSILLSVDINATNKSDQTKNLMILEFKRVAAEQALVCTEVRGERRANDNDPDHRQLGRLAVRFRS